MNPSTGQCKIVLELASQIIEYQQYLDWLNCSNIVRTMSVVANPWSNVEPGNNVKTNLVMPWPLPRHFSNDWTPEAFFVGRLKAFFHVVVTSLLTSSPYFWPIFGVNFLEQNFPKISDVYMQCRGQFFSVVGAKSPSSRFFQTSFRGPIFMLILTWWRLIDPCIHVTVDRRLARQDQHLESR